MVEKARLVGFGGQVIELIRTMRNANLSIDEMLRLIRDILDLLRFPVWSDWIAVQEWVQTLIDVLSGLADRTATELDNTVLSWMEQIVHNEQTWIVLHSFVMDLINGVQFDDERLTAVAETAAINVDFLIQLIELVKMLMEWWKNR
jgi:phage-related protein